jgi:hypothetical protein
MKFAFLQVFNTKVFVLIMRLLLMSRHNPFGKKEEINICSIVMEYADYGDLF